MKILFLCTAHNSLSQSLYLSLHSTHDITIEFAISQDVIIEAAELARPDLIICPFLTRKVPAAVYRKYLTLVVHPGPPGDEGPSSLDWLLMGDDGSIDESDHLIEVLDVEIAYRGRTHWGVTVLQAEEELDAGPIWAFEQFPVDIDMPGLTKSNLYRGIVTRAAVSAVLVAIDRILQASKSSTELVLHISPNVIVSPTYSVLSISDGLPWQGGKTHKRPLLKPEQREFDPKKHSALQISRRIRSADSQPGVKSKVFGKQLFLYGGTIEGLLSRSRRSQRIPGTDLLTFGVRNDAICIQAGDGLGVWITHIRRLKSKAAPALWPKIPAVPALIQLGILTKEGVASLQFNLPMANLLPHVTGETLEEIWTEYKTDENGHKAAYLHFHFYNGAMSTSLCSRLVDALENILKRSRSSPVSALVLMGSPSYFSNGIALNIIEAADDPSLESWLNINRINDIVQYYLLLEFPKRGILTFAAMRGNAAAGGVALAAACDVVIASADIILNPAYNAIGLFGSEFHTLTYPARCGEEVAKRLLEEMLPISPTEARRIGLVDAVFSWSSDEELVEDIQDYVGLVLKYGALTQGIWKMGLDLTTSTLAQVRASELGEMARDFWEPGRPGDYHMKRHEFVGKIMPGQTPLRFAKHRRLLEANSMMIDAESVENVQPRKSLQRIGAPEGPGSLGSAVSQRHGCSGTDKQPLLHKVGRDTQALASAKHAIFGSKGMFECYYDAAHGVFTPPKSPETSSSSASESNKNPENVSLI